MNRLTCVALLLASTALTRCGDGGPGVVGVERPRAFRAEPARPDCDAVAKPGVALQPLIDDVPEGGSLCLERGTYSGPLVLRHRMTLWGPPDAVILSTGAGTTVRVEADGAALLGFAVDGSGGRFDLLDAAIHVSGEGAVVEGVLITRAVFGLLVEKADRVTLRHNEIHGIEDGPIGLRGDPVRLWETRGSLVIGNRIVAGRDVVIWYSERNRIADNWVTSGRYGTHLMYAHHNLIEDNRYDDSVVGIFLMYSHDVTVRRNRLVGSHGAAGMGLGAKESGNLTVEGNAIIDNTIGVYLDTSPHQEDHHNLFRDNIIAFSEAGVVFHSSETRNRFVGNDLRDNRVQVKVEGEGHARGVDWRGNHWDDYQGYDLDDDGIGDLPYELRSLSGELVRRQPALAFLNGTPALWMIDAITHIAPLLAPRVMLVDPAPLMDAPRPATRGTADGDGDAS